MLAQVNQQFPVLLEAFFEPGALHVVELLALLSGCAVGLKGLGWGSVGLAHYIKPTEPSTRSYVPILVRGHRGGNRSEMIGSITAVRLGVGF